MIIDIPRNIYPNAPAPSLLTNLNLPFATLRSTYYYVFSII